MCALCSEILFDFFFSELCLVLFLACCCGYNCLFAGEAYVSPVAWHLLDSLLFASHCEVEEQPSRGLKGDLLIPYSMPIPFQLTLRVRAMCRVLPYVFSL